LSQVVTSQDRPRACSTSSGVRDRSLQPAAPTCHETPSCIVGLTVEPNDGRTRRKQDLMNQRLNVATATPELLVAAIGMINLWNRMAITFQTTPMSARHGQ
jgi:hypothetical protein